MVQSDGEASEAVFENCLMKCVKGTGKRDEANVDLVVEGSRATLNHG